MISSPDILNHNEMKRTWINSCRKVLRHMKWNDKSFCCVLSQQFFIAWET